MSNVWDRIRDDSELASARRAISIRDFTHIIRHATADYKQALTALVANPHGCRFCDYGTLRNPEKPHDDDCPYATAERLTTSEAPSILHHEAA